MTIRRIWAALSISAKALNRVFGYDQALQEANDLKAEAARALAQANG